MSGILRHEHRLRRMVAAGTACLIVLQGCALRPRKERATQEQPAPLGLEQYLATEPDAPNTAEKIALGRRLFFDVILSADGQMRCASCHQPVRAFTDGRPRSVGVYGRVGLRGVPSILNAGYARHLFWDGRDSVLEQQVLKPVVNPNELGMEMAGVVSRLTTDPSYRREFSRLFEEGVTARNLGRALASYVRTLRAGDSPYDRYVGGDTAALSADARFGYQLFVGRAGCVRCHAGPLLSDDDFHNTGVSWAGSDEGRALATGQASDRGKFNTPALRNVAATPPYMHDGSLATLEDVIRFYDGGGKPNPNLDPNIKPLQLSAVERSSLIAFLHALTSDRWGRSP